MKSKHCQQQKAASTTAGGKDKCYSSLVVLFPFFLSVASANSLSLCSPSIHLSPLLSRLFFWLHRRDAMRRDRRDGCVRTHACKRASDVSSTRRMYAPRKIQPLYTRSPCIFLSFLQHNQPVRDVTQAAERSRCSVRAKVWKGKSRCERVRRFCTFAAADALRVARCAHARERMDAEKARFPPFS